MSTGGLRQGEWSPCTNIQKKRQIIRYHLYLVTRIVYCQNAKSESAGKQRLWEIEQRHIETIRLLNSELSAEKERSTNDLIKFDSRLQTAEAKVSLQLDMH